MIRAFEKPIYVTKPFLPPLEEFCQGLSEIWESRWLTNNGPVLKRFTRELCHFFDTENLCLFNNGTLALQIALQGMRLSGEVITTPFTFVATTHALYWNQIRPVFADITPVLLHTRSRQGRGCNHTLDLSHPGGPCLRPPLQPESTSRRRRSPSSEADIRRGARIRRQGG